MLSRSILFLATCVLVGLGCTSAAEITEPTLKVKPDVIKKIETALPEKAPAKPKQARKLLVFSKTNGFRHGSIPVGVTAMRMLGKSTGAFTVFHTEDEAIFEPAKLKEFDAVLMLNTTGDIFRPKDLPKDKEQREAVLAREEKLKQSLVDFVKGGKGLAGLHSATDTYHRWGAYNDMMGGTFAGHPWHMKVPVKNLAPDHPLNAAFGGKDFEITDEIYQFRDGTANASDRRMLLALDGKWDGLAKGKRKDNQWPISWVATYGKGRTFYCSLGHRDEIFHNAAVLKHYLAGLQYVFGDLEAEAKATPTK